MRPTLPIQYRYATFTFHDLTVPLHLHRPLSYVTVTLPLYRTIRLLYIAVPSPYLYRFAGFYETSVPLLFTVPYATLLYCTFLRPTLHYRYFTFTFASTLPYI